MHHTPRKVLVIGSGPIIIGQAAEFDYSGSQACKALKEDGIEVIVLNPNPATIQTDKVIADRIYLEPLTIESVEQIFRKENPDSLIATMGGQAGLNLAMELAESGILKEYGVRLLGTGLEAIKKGEDREEFKNLLMSIDQPFLPSKTVSSVREALEFADQIGYPLIVRPAFTLGGTGGGKARNKDELETIVDRGLVLSPISQVLLEKDVSGIAEIEFEMVRDTYDNCIAVCHMENFDPMGIHTGESIVVAPCQTLSDHDVQILRDASIKIIRALGIVGGCNIQFALDQGTGKYYVIEVNPRLSRSSALASKATGYPIARVAAKLAIGYKLFELENMITRTCAGFEPTLDYVVVKIPKWQFYKFKSVDRTIGTQMKSVGEVMGIGKTFEEAFNKALQGLEIQQPRFKDDAVLNEYLNKPTDLRVFAIMEALQKGYTVEQIHLCTGIHKWFLYKLLNIVRMRLKLQSTTLNAQLIREAKRVGISDLEIAKLTDSSEYSIRQLRKSAGIKAVFKMVDSCGGEFEAKTPYYYSTYESSSELKQSSKKKILILGSGPIRIGQGIEFDYCTVHSSSAVKDQGYESLIVNCNPETVSTDFDASDRLYFEPVTVEKVRDIMDAEQVDGVIVQFAGQTGIDVAVNLGNGYAEKILGTTIESIDIAEDREKFRELLNSLGIKQPTNAVAKSVEEALEAGEKIGYPVVVRPSYVIAGRGMEIVFNREELKAYMENAVVISGDKPVLIDKFIDGVECEVDAVSDGEEVFIGGIMEHIEKAGVHSGDAYTVIPPISLGPDMVQRIVDYSIRITRALKIIGMINIQYVVLDNEVYVLEANPRASRTVPFLSKASGYSLVKIATQVMLGRKLREMGLPLMPRYSNYAVKGVVFPFIKMQTADVVLGPEMKSTGETMGLGKDFETAFLKAVVAANPALVQVLRRMKKGEMISIGITLSDRTKKYAPQLVEYISSLNVEIYATEGTASVLSGFPKIKVVKKLFQDPDNNLIRLLEAKKLDIVINTPSKGYRSYTDGYKIRRYAVERGIPCLTTIETAMALLRALVMLKEKSLEVSELSEFYAH